MIDPLPPSVCRRALALRPATWLLAAAAVRFASQRAEAQVGGVALIAGALALVHDLLPALLARRALRVNGEEPLRAIERAARVSLLVDLALVVVGLSIGVALQSDAATAWFFGPPRRARWWAESGAACAALLLVGQALPLPGSDGFVLIEAALRRARPQLVATRLTSRVGGSLAAVMALAIAVAPPGPLDGIGWGLAAALLAAAWLEQRGAFGRALAREWALQSHTTRHVASLRPLSPAQFDRFRLAAERAYVARVSPATRAGARQSSTKPPTSASSNSPTDPA